MILDQRSCKELHFKHIPNKNSSKSSQSRSMVCTIGWLYATYHLQREPGNNHWIKMPLSKSSSKRHRAQLQENPNLGWLIAAVRHFLCACKYMGVSLNGGTPKHPHTWSFLVGKPWLLGTTILGNPHIVIEKKCSVWLSMVLFWLEKVSRI